MDKKSGHLSHDEIWDDSALVDSWNEALEEYKKYHSIHAKGGKLKDLEQLAHDADAQSHIQGHDTRDRPDETEAEELSSTGGGAGLEDQMPKADDAEHQPSTNEAHAVPGLIPPQLVMGSVRDENLKKLLMSWYYAGYYTGLYEGQQQASQQAQQKGP